MIQRRYIGDYLNPKFLQFLNKDEIKIVVEVGARDCLDTIEMAKNFKESTFFCFECNPDTINQCYLNLELSTIEIKNRILFFPFAVGSREQESHFYKWKDKTNPGASSFLKRKQDFYNQEITGEKIQIKRMDSVLNKFEITEIDLLCLDIQGYELEALRGLGSLINNVNYIITEIPKSESLYDAPSRQEMLDFFNDNGFKILECVRENDHEDNILLAKVKR
jgi:FkbM family methyltransferase